MRTVALQLSSSHVSIRNIKSRLIVVIKSLITNDLFFSERVFKNANLYSNLRLMHYRPQIRWDSRTA